MRKLFIVLLSIFLYACAATPSSGEVALVDLYPDLPEDNHFQVIAKDDLEDFMQHGTGILFFGFPECPWCQAYLPLAEEVLSSVDVTCRYYNIYADKKQDRPFYDEICTLLESINDSGHEIVRYDNDGKQVVYMPLMMFIENGRIVSYDDETCTEDSSVISPQDYWTKDKITALQQRLQEASSFVKA